MKLFSTTLLALALALTSGFAEESKWLHDFEAAKAQAKAEKKPILINFTGSDWCGWCIRLEKEVFKKEAFKKYAKDHLVLMEVDFPRNKKQDEKVIEQNKDLDVKFEIEGYPTVFLLNEDGEKISDDIGYREGGPEKYVTHLKSLIEK